MRLSGSCYMVRAAKSKQLVCQTVYNILLFNGYYVGRRSCDTAIVVLLSHEDVAVISPIS